jgi:hypothetical protein
MFIPLIPDRCTVSTSVMEQCFNGFNLQTWLYFLLIDRVCIQRPSSISDGSRDNSVSVINGVGLLRVIENFDMFGY